MKPLLEKNIGSKLLDMGLGKDFFNLTPKETVAKVKINKWAYIKQKCLYTAKETINRIKR